MDVDKLGGGWGWGELLHLAEVDLHVRHGLLAGVGVAESRYCGLRSLGGLDAM